MQQPDQKTAMAQLEYDPVFRLDIGNQLCERFGLS